MLRACAAQYAAPAQELGAHSWYERSSRNTCKDAQPVLSIVQQSSGSSRPIVQRARQRAALNKGLRTDIVCCSVCNKRTGTRNSWYKRSCKDTCKDAQPVLSSDQSKQLQTPSNERLAATDVVCCSVCSKRTGTRVHWSHRACKDTCKDAQPVLSSDQSKRLKTPSNERLAATDIVCCSVCSERTGTRVHWSHRACKDTCKDAQPVLSSDQSKQLQTPSNERLAATDVVCCSVCSERTGTRVNWSRRACKATCKDAQPVLSSDQSNMTKRVLPPGSPDMYIKCGCDTVMRKGRCMVTPALLLQA